MVNYKNYYYIKIRLNKHRHIIKQLSELVIKKYKIHIDRKSVFQQV